MVLQCKIILTIGKTSYRLANVGTAARYRNNDLAYSLWLLTLCSMRR
jgi:hypothetical protein